MQPGTRAIGTTLLALWLIISGFIEIVLGTRDLVIVLLAIMKIVAGIFLLLGR